VDSDTAQAYRRLAEALDDITLHRNLLALLPWTVHVDHAFERSQERALRLLSRLPTQRAPLDLRPHVRAGTPRGRGR